MTFSPFTQLEAVFVDCTFAILMWPVTMLTALVELFFDTTEYPSMGDSTPVNEPQNKSRPTNLATYWSVYVNALRNLIKRCQSIPELVLTFRVLVCFACPPFPVYMKYGATSRFWLVFFISLPWYWPGVVMALYEVVLKEDFMSKKLEAAGNENSYPFMTKHKA